MQCFNGLQELLAARATQAASTGLKCGLYQALKGPCIVCSGASSMLAMSVEKGMRHVGCNWTVYNERESSTGTAATVRFLTFRALDF